MAQRKVLIVFADIHLPYSPSTLNLFYALKQRDICTTLIAGEPEGWYSLHKIVDPDIKYIETCVPEQSKAISRVWNKIAGRISPPDPGELNRRSLLSWKASTFIDEISKQDVDIIIAVDSFSLWCVQQAGKAAHLLSLEIREPDPYYDSCDISAIQSVIIQTKERYDYVFRGPVRPPYSIIPNSPILLDFTPNYSARKKYSLIYCGSAVHEFGIFSCFDFICDHPEYRLAIKGAVPVSTREGIERFYGCLLEEGRLTIDERYLDPPSLTRYISEYWAGIAFYDFYRQQSLRKFNYYTAPSGKLYQYFNAGLPVVGNQLPGFEIVEKFKVGRLIPYLSSIQIKRAFDAVEAAYAEMAIGAKRLSRELDPTALLNRFIDLYIE